MNENALLVVHPGSGTVLDASECRLVAGPPITDLVNEDDGEAIIVDTLRKNPAAGLTIDDPMSAIWFNADAVREHFAESCVDLSDLSDEQVAEIGQSALMHDAMWSAFAEAMADGLAYVRAEAAK